jgi:hypothetical protein
MLVPVSDDRVSDDRVGDDWRRGDSEPAAPEDEDKLAAAQEATAIAFAGLSRREAAARTLGC